MEPLPEEDLEGLEVLGFGTFGIVYKGRSKKLGRDVALKIIRGKSGEDFKDFMNEKELILKANDTYVIRVLTTYKKQEKSHVDYGLVLEYMPHGTLHCLFDTFNKHKDLVPWALRFRILHQVTLAMNFLHSLKPPIIHRDLKPQNVLLDDYLNIRVADFGLARTATSVSSDNGGTPSYMPPEAWESNAYKPTEHFDVYSFAILTWSVLSGLDPYPDKNKQLIRKLVLQKKRPPMDSLDHCENEKEVPQAIDMMKKCWAHEPSERPSFAECVCWLEEMNKPYAEEITRDVFDVLNNLKFYSSQVVRRVDQPDGAHSSASSNIGMTFRIENLINKLHKDFDTEAIILSDSEKFLRKNFATIVEEKPTWNFILDGLFTQQIFTTQQVDHIKSRSSIQNQIRETLTMIMKQGQLSCRTLLQLMNRHHPSLIKSLTVPANMEPS